QRGGAGGPGARPLLPRDLLLERPAGDRSPLRVGRGEDVLNPRPGGNDRVHAVAASGENETGGSAACGRSPRVASSADPVRRPAARRPARAQKRTTMSTGLEAVAFVGFPCAGWSCMTHWKRAVTPWRIGSFSGTSYGQFAGASGWLGVTRAPTTQRLEGSNPTGEP